MTRPNYRKLFIGISVLLAFVATMRVHAYELATHARLTLEAFNRCILVDSQFLKNLGIDSMLLDSSGYAPNPFGTIYYDVSGSAVNERQANPDGVTFDARFLGLTTENPDQTFIFPAWLMRGAIREDDLMWPAGDNPQDDPYSTLGIMRVCNHFYDPITNQPLTIHDVRPCSLLLQPNDIAPRWAIGSTDVFTSLDTPDTGRRNHFTIFDAREAMYRALTGKSKEGNDVAPTKDDRNKYWATLFRALGDIVHLVQDMAQPQHTRNDPHAGKKYDGISGLLGHKSVYESYVEARARGGTFEVPGILTVTANGLTYDGYPIPRFTDYLSYFTTRHKENDLLKRQGLADYSNRGFFSAGTNIESENNVYTLPDRNPAAYVPTNLYVDWQGQPLGSDPNARVTILQGSVPDSLPGGQTATNIPLTTYGAWDQFLRSKGKTNYSLNRYNYDAMANLLIPRAVAYSAGIIDYFFRGRIEADAYYTDTGISLVVKNTIDPRTDPPEWQNETLYAKNSSGIPSKLIICYEYKDSQGGTHYGTSDIVNMIADANNSANDDNIAPGSTSRHSYSFYLSIPVRDVNDLKYRLVFRGKFGNEEDAVVAGVIEPMSNFVFTPSYIPDDGVSTGSSIARTIYRSNSQTNPGGQWNLGKELGRVGGNVDWKGWYDDGKPTKVLSWTGLNSRYFPDSYSYYAGSPNYFGFVDAKIYQNGEVFAIAPRVVLGAALNRDSAGKEWLVTICRDGNDNMTDVVYRRHNKKSSSPALYHPIDQPEGWQEIGRFTHDTNLFNPANAPWFFNGSGTEAQTVRSGHKADDPYHYLWLFRLKITISGDSAQFSNEGNSDGVPIGTSVSTKTCNDNDSVSGSCGPGCTGGWDHNVLSEQKITVQNQWSGQTIVAVDYVQDTPVYATFSYVSSDTRQRTISGKHLYSFACNSRGGYCYSDSSYEEHVSSDEIREGYNTVKTLSITGYPDVIMQSVTGAVHVSYKTTTSGTASSSQSTTDKSGTASNLKISSGRLRYLDLRYGLYSLYTQTTETSGQTDGVDLVGPPPYTYSFVLPYTKNVKQAVSFQNSEIPVNAVPLSGTAPVQVTTNIYSFNGPCNSSETNSGVAAPVFFEDVINDSNSSRAVDSNGHLFVSESKLDEILQTAGRFNYLTGATGTDPGSVIPTAPQDAYYTGIRVIK